MMYSNRGLYFTFFRVFSDRLVDDKDREAFVGILTEKLANLFDQTYHNICQNKQPPIFGECRTLLAAKIDIYNLISAVGMILGNYVAYAW